MRNTAVMIAAMFISKGLGAVLKIPLGNILGGVGMGYFTTAYSIFTPVLSFVCAGIPTILTRSVASYAANKEYSKIRSARRCSLILAAAAGILGAALIYIAALPFVGFIANSPESLPGVLVIAPAVLFCSVTAVYRGYYEGLNDMLPTALSQVIEAIVKAGLGVGLSYFVYSNGERLFGSQSASLPFAAAAAILGVTVSEMCGTLFIFLRARRKSDSFAEYDEKLTGKEIFALCKEIFFKALPISLGAAASNLLSLADMLTISNCVDLSASLFAPRWEADPFLSRISAAEGGAGNFMYGCYAGIIMSVYMLAAAASAVVGRCVMPRLAFAAETHQFADTERELRLLIKGTAVISAPLTVFMAVLSQPILRILYPFRETEAALSALPLTILSAGGIAAALLGAVCTVFYAYGDFSYPIKITLIGGALKLLFNIAFIIVPELNITGAAISAVLSNLICLLLAGREAEKKLGVRVRYASYSLPAIFAALGGGTGVYLFFRGLSENMGTLAGVLISIVLGSIMYILILYIADSRDSRAVIDILRRKAECR